MENGVHRVLGNIEGQLAQLIKSFDEYKVKQQEDHKEIETRVSAIETKVNRAAAVVGFVLFVFTFTSDFILTKLGLKT